jgi:uncharacterized protein YbcI
MAPDQRPADLCVPPDPADVSLHALEAPRAAAMPLGSAPMPSGWSELGEAADRREQGTLAAELTRRIVGLLREHTGSGATTAKAAITSELVVVTLVDCFTTLEKQLADNGQGELVTQGRRGIHDAMRLEATAIVEELTNEHVSAYLSAQQADADLAFLVFYLAPLRPSAA